MQLKEQKIISLYSVIKPHYRKDILTIFLKDILGRFRKHSHLPGKSTQALIAQTLACARDRISAQLKASHPRPLGKEEEPIHTDVTSVPWSEFLWSPPHPPKWILWPPEAKSWLTGKDPDAGKDWRQKEKRAAKGEMVRWHHRLNGHESEQTLGGSGEQGSLESQTCNPWGHKESATT